jgi:hypothetical protein
MGSGVRVEVATTPPAVTPENPAVEAWLDQEALSYNRNTRFLVLIFWDDRPRILASVLEVFDAGVSVDARDTARGRRFRTGRFSIDGSLSSSIAGIFMLAFIVRPLDQQVAADGTATCRALEAQIESKLNDLGRESRFEPRVTAVEYVTPNENILLRRRFAEYRFGVDADGSGAASGTGGDLGELAADFAQELQKLDIPIAYMYFPDRWGGESISWLRVGVGAKARLVDSLSVDLAANRLAEAYGCYFRVYDPTADGASMRQHFRDIADYRRPEGFVEAVKDGAPGDGVVHADGDAEVDVVVSSTPAHVGDIARTLAGVGGEHVLGASVTVLSGTTISCWVVVGGHGKRFRDQIESVARQRGTLDVTQMLQSPPGLTLPVLRDQDQQSFWIAWRCDDRAGIIKDVVGHLLEYVGRRGTPDDVDIKYAVLRVLEDRRSCAGKINFVVARREVADWLDDERLTILRKGLQELLLPSAPGRTGKLPEVVVSTSEPGGQPWASLVVGVGSSAPAPEQARAAYGMRNPSRARNDAALLVIGLLTAAAVLAVILLAGIR